MKTHTTSDFSADASASTEARYCSLQRTAAPAMQIQLYGPASMMGIASSRIAERGKGYSGNRGKSA